MDVYPVLPYLVFAIALISVVGAEPACVDRRDRLLLLRVGRAHRARPGLSIKEKEYIEAARSLGAGDLRIMFVDILPERARPGASST